MSLISRHGRITAEYAAGSLSAPGNEPAAPNAENRQCWPRLTRTASPIMRSCGHRGRPGAPFHAVAAIATGAAPSFARLWPFLAATTGQSRALGPHGKPQVAKSGLLGGSIATTRQTGAQGLRRRPQPRKSGRETVTRRSRRRPRRPRFRHQPRRSPRCSRRQHRHSYPSPWPRHHRPRPQPAQPRQCP